ncbi:MAG: hypothetical protein KIT69_17465, partial [Propionibacteriaceae bacterium]|nr:hypothetical protein [Propionibacteriaceae bacterium]
MKRVSNSTRVAVLAWVVALALPLGPGAAPMTGADDTDLGAAPAAMADPPLPEKTADPPAEKPASAEKPEPAEKPAPGDEPGPPAVEKPAPRADPSSEPAGSEAEAPPVPEPGDEGSPAGAPPETPPAASPPAATPDVAPVVDGSPADLVSPSAADPEDPAIPGSGLLAGLEESPTEATIEPMSIAPSDLCAIGDTGYATLDAAIAAAVSGQTITVLKSFTHASPVVVDGKNLTLDLDEGSITIDTSGSTGTTALLVKNAIVTLTGGGHIDVRGALAGVRAENGRITVRYATALWGSGAYALNGGDITVRGDAKGFAVGALAFGAGSTVTVGDDAMATGGSGRGAEAVQGGQVMAKNALAMVIGGTGASAYRGGTVTIAQQATGIAYGATAYETGVVTVGGDVTATGGSGVGAWAYGGGKITVDGQLAGTTYLRVGDADKGEGDAEPVTTLPGYRTYLDGTSTVWVKGAPVADNVCAIGAQEFPTLDEALAKADGTASAPTVIRLLKTIDYDKTLTIGGK